MTLIYQNIFLRLPFSKTIKVCTQKEQFRVRALENSSVIEIFVDILPFIFATPCLLKHLICLLFWLLVVSFRWMQTLWRTVWRFLKKLIIKLSYDSEILFLGTLPEKTIIQEGTCTPMFIAALFAIARIWKQPICSSTEEWRKKMWYIYAMEYYLATKRNGIVPLAEMWLVLKTVSQSEVSQKEIMSRFLNDRDLTSFFMVTVPATYQVLKVLSYKCCEKMWQSENWQTSIFQIFF